MEIWKGTGDMVSSAGSRRVGGRRGLQMVLEFWIYDVVYVSTRGDKKRCEEWDTKSRFQASTAIFIQKGRVQRIGIGQDTFAQIAACIVIY